MENLSGSFDGTRRGFLKQVATAAVLASAVDLGAQMARGQGAPAPAATGPVPWYRRSIRWGQTNITEADIEHYDIPFWRAHWKRTNLHGVIVNAGGIYAYYPSKFPLHYQPPQLKGRDLFGELAKAAHDDGLAVLARMDSSKVHEPMFRAHPEWIAMQANGQPYMSGEFYLTCIHSGYYETFLPDVMREIAERSHPEGFTDNIWNGLERTQICYCQNCATKFKAAKNLDLPRARNWTDPAFRQWLEWSYARRIEMWEMNNKITQAAGGKECIWIGMNGGNISGQSASFRDLKEICSRAEIIMLDNQSRDANFGIQENAFAGKLIHSVLGWDKMIPESMAMYQHGRPQYRLSAKSQPEARMWMYSGFAGGIQPWWHHVGAYDEDRRPYKTAEPVMAFHKANEDYLINRLPMASVGIGWSHRNTDFFGRDTAEELTDLPLRGFVQAMVQARIPHLPVHLDYLDRDAPSLSVLILPNVGILTEGQLASVRKFVAGGGALIATGQTSLYDQWGDALPDFALADLLGVKGATPAAPRGRGPAGAAGAAAAPTDAHTYLRLTPELRAQVYGPKWPDEPAPTGERHPILSGFEETDILPYGGTLSAGLIVDRAAQVLLTFIPAFPATPPEDSYMRTRRTDLPGLVIKEAAGGAGRVVYLAADIDRRFAMDNFPDHGNLLANMVRWAAKDSLPLDVRGPGLVNCELYRQQDRLILHVVNLTSAATWRPPVHEVIAIGPLRVGVKIPAGMSVKSARARVGGQTLEMEKAGNLVQFEIKSLLEHELIVIE